MSIHRYTYISFKGLPKTKKIFFRILSTCLKCFLRYTVSKEDDKEKEKEKERLVPITLSSNGSPHGRMAFRTLLQRRQPLLWRLFPPRNIIKVLLFFFPPPRTCAHLSVAAIVVGQWKTLCTRRSITLLWRRSLSLKTDWKSRRKKKNWYFSSNSRVNGSSVVVAYRNIVIFAGNLVFSAARIYFYFFFGRVAGGKSEKRWKIVKIRNYSAVSPFQRGQKQQFSPVARENRRGELFFSRKKNREKASSPPSLFLS